MNSASTGAAQSAEPLLDVRDLRVVFTTEGGPLTAVDGLSFTVERGRTLAIVGESGSGKSVANLAILGLHNPRRTAVTGSIMLAAGTSSGAPTDLLGLSEAQLRSVRGRRVAMVFQDPMTALSPYYTIGDQIAEVHRRHTGSSRRRARERAIELLDRVGLPDPAKRAREYPHRFSGGMRQRVVIAVALACEPDLLIADEPTTALDVTVQAQILELLAELQRESGMAIVIVTHDLGVVAGFAHEVMVMYAGRCAERGTVDEVLRSPRHPYTWGLLQSVPRLTGPIRDLIAIEGTPPDPLAVPPGCPFQPRCAYAGLVTGISAELGGDCVTLRPETPAPGAHGAACLLPESVASTIHADRILPLLQDKDLVDAEPAAEANVRESK